MNRPFVLLCLIGSLLAACDRGPARPDRETLALGQRIYAAECATCHGADGRGVSGEHPPVRDSDWVSGDSRRLIAVILHGLKGPIEVNGEAWTGEMPGFAALSDEDIAALLSYLRTEHLARRAAPISPDEVAAERVHSLRYQSTIPIAGRDPPRRKIYRGFREGYLALDRLVLPPGFRIEVFATVPNPRSLARGTKGTIFAGNHRYGDAVYAVVDRDGDHRADAVHVIARGLAQPNAVAFHEGDLYVGEIIRILKFADIEDRLTDPPAPSVVFDGFPNQTRHEKKFMRIGPDGRLYVPVGADCNVCLPKNPLDATITRLNLDGTGLEVIARGVRNAVGLDWHPVTGELWFTDNGRDHMGDDVPPCEVNRLAREGAHFGFPHCHGRAVTDPEFAGTDGCASAVPPEIEIEAHAAPLGMLFYRGGQFPEAYRGALFVAEHGSWNRSRKVGYQVSIARMVDGRLGPYEPFITGWLDRAKDDYWGRPVDLLELPDGSLLLSDDWADVIYRISYTAPDQTRP